MLLSVSSTHHPPSQHRPRPSTPSSSFTAIPLSSRGPVLFARRHHRCHDGTVNAGLYAERARSVRVDVVPRTSPTSDCPSFSPPPSSPPPPFQSLFLQDPSVSDEPLRVVSIPSRLLVEEIDSLSRQQRKGTPSFVHLPIGMGLHGVHCVFN